MLSHNYWMHRFGGDPSVLNKSLLINDAELTVVGVARAGFTGVQAGQSPDIFVPLLTLYIKLALLAGGLGNNRGAVLGAIVVVTFLEATRFIVPLLPGLTYVQGAALREILISASLIIVLRFRPQGLMPEARIHPVLTTLDAGKVLART